MELDKYLQNVKLSKNERETKYWKENYDKALENLMVIPVMDKQEIEDNQFQITRYKAKYPFYLNVIELIKTESDNDLLKSKIVNEILTYLDVVYRDGNIVIAKGNYNSISKKVYSKEKTSILTDLKMMLYEAILNKKIQKLIENRGNSQSLMDTEYVQDFSKWNSIIMSLKSDGIIDEKEHWLDLGSGYSESPTQVAVFLFLLIKNRVIKIPKREQKKVIEQIGKYFNVELGPSRYSQVKKGFDDTEGISMQMMYYNIYIKLKYYFKS